jgi:hypothetical protein
MLLDGYDYVPSIIPFAKAATIATTGPSLSVNIEFTKR